MQMQAQRHQQALEMGLNRRSKYLRHLVLRTLIGGDRGHIGPSLSPIEILMVLYDSIMQHDPQHPGWLERDRFILSKGHGAIAHYAILADYGYFPLETLDSFCQFNSLLGTHAEASKVPGVEASTGALGHGLALAVGMAIAAKIKQYSHHVYVLIGDGEMNEGSIWEAALLAHKHHLTNLTVIVDYNKIQSAGLTQTICNMEPLAAKWQAFGFEVTEVNGHCLTELEQAFKTPQSAPKMIIAHTIKGKGVREAEHNPKWHHVNRMTEEVVEAFKSSLEAYHAPSGL